jgi:hypothetical protein
VEEVCAPLGNDLAIFDQPVDAPYGEDLRRLRLSSLSLSFACQAVFALANKGIGFLGKDDTAQD